jgi:excisionase family DNA binding protein
VSAAELPKLVGYERAAELLDVPIKLLQKWTSQKRVPHVRLGPRIVKFDEAELARWIEDRRIATK